MNGWGPAADDVSIISRINIRVHVAKFMFASSDRKMFLPTSHQIHRLLITAITG